MASINRKPAYAASVKDIPLSVRFKAWWEGYDPDSLYSLIASTKKIPPTSLSGANPKATGQSTTRRSLQSLKPFTWSEQRAAANQLVWGPGFLEPPIPLDSKLLIRKLEIKPGHVIAAIGSGLGGFDRYLFETHNCQIEGYDVRSDIVDLGNRSQNRESGAKYPSLAAFDPASDQPLSRRYDRMFMTNTLGRVSALPTLLAKLSKALRPGSKFLIFDWFRTPGKTANELVSALGDNSDPHFVSMLDSSETCRLLGANNFSISENILMTSEAVEALTKPWRLIVDSMTEVLHDMDRRDLIDELLAEAELWASRVSLAGSDHIEARLFTGVFTGKSDR